MPEEITQIALFVFASKANVITIGGGQVALASELYFEIVNGLRGKRVSNQAVPEQFPLLRTIQYCCEYESILFPQSSDQVSIEVMTRFVQESNDAQK